MFRPHVQLIDIAIPYGRSGKVNVVVVVVGGGGSGSSGGRSRWNMVVVVVVVAAVVRRKNHKPPNTAIAHDLCNVQWTVAEQATLTIIAYNIYPSS